MWFRIVTTVALQDVGPSARPPRRPRTASKSATKTSRWVMSLTFAAVTCATSGTPRALVTMWCLDPALLRSVGFGPVFFPAHRATDPLSTTFQRWFEPSPSAQLGEEGLMQATPDAGPLPLHQASPARAA